MDEYIEREAAIANSREYNLGGSYDNTERAVPVDAINSISAADVRPVVRAKWESHGEGFKWVYICSGCGFVDGYPMNDRMHYCPNCGCAMEG